MRIATRLIVDDGVEVHERVLLCPGAIVAAGAPAPVVKLAPVTAVRSMVTVEVPVLVTVKL